MDRRILLCGAALLGTAAGMREVHGVEPAWPMIRQSLFRDRPIADAHGLLILDAPARAANSAVVPISLRVQVVDDVASRFSRLWFLVDENPAPLAASFDLNEWAGVTSIETRVRVNAYTPLHLVGETRDGRLFAVNRFIKAAGGCSAPSTKDATEAQERLGRMKLRVAQPLKPGHLVSVQLLIAHPQYTGMQIDQVSRIWIPPDYVQSINVEYRGRRVLHVNGDISLSEDPSFAFSFLAEQPGDLRVAVADSSGRHFEQSWHIASDA